MPARMMGSVLAGLLASAFCCAGADPILAFSTYLGGSGSEFTPKVVSAPDGSIWVAMTTNSPDLPVSADASQKALASGWCIGDLPYRCPGVYVAKLSSSGQILRSTYLGGSVSEYLTDIHLDAAAHVWVAGSTSSADFPRAKVIGTPEAKFSGAFVVEFSADLGSILQSTVVIGGTPSALIVDSAGAAYIAGGTESSALPTVNALQPSLTPGLPGTAGFVAKLAPGGSSLAYATYFGGSTTEIQALAVDASGHAILGGYTEAGDLPAGGARYGQRSGASDAFVAKIAADGRSVVWLRYVGGNDYDSLNAMAVDAAGNLYLGGETFSADFPGVDYSGEGASDPRGFVVKVAADGSSVLSSRIFGYDVQTMAVDGSGLLWISGEYCFEAFDASSSAFQIARSGYGTDAYLVHLGDTGPPLWASYIGGTGTNSGTSVAATSDGVVLAGTTQSFDFPVDHAAQSSLDQDPNEEPVLPDGFVMRFGSAAMGAPAFSQAGIENAASYVSGEAAPGSIVSIFGSDLATVVRQASAIPLPQVMGDAVVTVNGVAAPLFYVSPSQINAQIPFGSALGTGVIQVSRGGTPSATVTVPIVATSPGLFVAINGFAVIDAPSSALRGGDWVTMYATGLGAVNGPVTTGAAPGNPPPQVSASVSVTLGGTPLVVTWVGLAPGFAGLYQINATLPADIAKGIVFADLPLVVTAGGKASNPGLVQVTGLAAAARRKLPAQP
jgi:uncharacterized protein (TIGR03437 family)